jgi:hypothetical protein
VTGYRVERCTGAGCSNFAQIATPSGTSYGDTSLAGATSYSYRVRAVDAANNAGGYSPVASATTVATTSGLVAAYGFDEGTGSTVSDASGAGNTGVLTNTTWTASGRVGSALVFNGTSSRVTIADAPSLRLAAAMTLEAWVYPTAIDGRWRDVIMKGDDDYYLTASSSSGGGRPAAGGTFMGSPLFASSPLPINTWTHLAVTYDGANLRLYVNGSQVASAPRTGTMTVTANPLQIGSDPFYGQYFTGRIDEVRIYNTARTAADIASDMSAPVGGN